MHEYPNVPTPDGTETLIYLWWNNDLEKLLTWSEIELFKNGDEDFAEELASLYYLPGIPTVFEYAQHFSLLVENDDEFEESLAKACRSYDELGSFGPGRFESNVSLVHEHYDFNKNRIEFIINFERMRESLGNMDDPASVASNSFYDKARERVEEVLFLLDVIGNSEIRSRQEENLAVWLCLDGGLDGRTAIKWAESIEGPITKEVKDRQIEIAQNTKNQTDTTPYEPVDDPEQIDKILNPHGWISQIFSNEYIYFPLVIAIMAIFVILVWLAS